MAALWRLVWLRLRQLVGVDHAPAGKAAHRCILAALGHREAAFRAAEHAMRLDHLRLGIPGVMDHDRARLGIAVRPVESANAEREAVLALVIVAGHVGAVRARIAAEIVAEPL